MIRTIVWFTYFFAYLLVVAPIYLHCRRLVKSGQREKAQPVIDSMVYNWARRLLRLAGAQITVFGQDNLPEETAVYVVNHQSDFDIPVVLTQTGKPRALMAKSSLAKIPGIHGWMELLQCVFLDRNDDKQAVRALMDSTKLVKSGISLTIFPEGTRSKGGAMHEFKGGAFRIATRAKVPIVPVTIEGTYHLLEERGRIHPSRVYVTIHPPIRTEGMSRQEIAALPQRVEQQIVSAMTHDK